MPYKSDAQRRYFNANREELEAQGVDVGEWNDSSRGEKLPERAKKKRKKKAAAPPSESSVAPLVGRRLAELAQKAPRPTPEQRHNQKQLNQRVGHSSEPAARLGIRGLGALAHPVAGAADYIRNPGPVISDIFQAVAPWLSTTPYPGKGPAPQPNDIRAHMGPAELEAYNRAYKKESADKLTLDQARQNIAGAKTQEELLNVNKPKDPLRLQKSVADLALLTGYHGGRGLSEIIGYAQRGFRGLPGKPAIPPKGPAVTDKVPFPKRSASDVTLGTSQVHGTGLFAKDEFETDDVLALAGGRMRGKDAQSRYELTKAARYTNHSEDPSAQLVKVGEELYLAALRDIQPGEEILVDYSKTATVVGPGSYITYRGHTRATWDELEKQSNDGPMFAWGMEDVFTGEEHPNNLYDFRSGPFLKQALRNQPGLAAVPFADSTRANAALWGAGIGGLGGAALGAYMNKKKRLQGALLGGLAGLATGGATGYSLGTAYEGLVGDPARQAAWDKLKTEELLAAKKEYRDRFIAEVHESQKPIIERLRKANFGRTPGEWDEILDGYWPRSFRDMNDVVKIKELRTPRQTGREAASGYYDATGTATLSMADLLRGAYANPAVGEGLGSGELADMVAQAYKNRKKYPTPMMPTQIWEPEDVYRKGGVEFQYSSETPGKVVYKWDPKTNKPISFASGYASQNPSTPVQVGASRDFRGGRSLSDRNLSTLRHELRHRYQMGHPRGRDNKLRYDSHRNPSELLRISDSYDEDSTARNLAGQPITGKVWDFSPAEVDAELGDIKQWWFQTTGKVINTPEEGLKALDAFMSVDPNGFPRQSELGTGAEWTAAVKKWEEGTTLASAGRLEEAARKALTDEALAAEDSTGSTLEAFKKILERAKGKKMHHVMMPKTFQDYVVDSSAADARAPSSWKEHPRWQELRKEFARRLTQLVQADTPATIDASKMAAWNKVLGMTTEKQAQDPGYNPWNWYKTWSEGRELDQHVADQKRRRATRASQTQRSLTTTPSTTADPPAVEGAPAEPGWWSQGVTEGSEFPRWGAAAGLGAAGLGLYGLSRWNAGEDEDDEEKIVKQADIPPEDVAAAPYWQVARRGLLPGGVPVRKSRLLENLWKNPGPGNLINAFMEKTDVGKKVNKGILDIAEPFGGLPWHHDPKKEAAEKQAAITEEPHPDLAHLHKSPGWSALGTGGLIGGLSAIPGFGLGGSLSGTLGGAGLGAAATGIPLGIMGGMAGYGGQKEQNKHLKRDWVNPELIAFGDDMSAPAVFSYPEGQLPDDWREQEMAKLNSLGFHGIMPDGGGNYYMKDANGNPVMWFHELNRLYPASDAEYDETYESYADEVQYPLEKQALDPMISSGLGMAIPGALAGGVIGGARGAFSPGRQPINKRQAAVLLRAGVPEATVASLEAGEELSEDEETMLTEAGLDLDASVPRRGRLQQALRSAGKGALVGGGIGGIFGAAMPEFERWRFKNTVKNAPHKVRLPQSVGGGDLARLAVDYRNVATAPHRLSSPLMGHWPSYSDMNPAQRRDVGKYVGNLWDRLPRADQYGIMKGMPGNNFAFESISKLPGRMWDTALGGLGIEKQNAENKTLVGETAKGLKGFADLISDKVDDADEEKKKKDKEEKQLERAVARNTRERTARRIAKDRDVMGKYGNDIKIALDVGRVASGLGKLGVPAEFGARIAQRVSDFYKASVPLAPVQSHPAKIGPKKDQMLADVQNAKADPRLAGASRGLPALPASLQPQQQAPGLYGDGPLTPGWAGGEYGLNERGGLDTSGTKIGAAPPELPGFETPSRPSQDPYWEWTHPESTQRHPMTNLSSLNWRQSPRGSDVPYDSPEGRAHRLANLREYSEVIRNWGTAPGQGFNRPIETHQGAPQTESMSPTDYDSLFDHIDPEFFNDRELQRSGSTPPPLRRQLNPTPNQPWHSAPPSTRTPLPEQYEAQVSPPSTPTAEKQAQGVNEREREFYRNRPGVAGVRAKQEQRRQQQFSLQEKRLQDAGYQRRADGKGWTKDQTLWAKPAPKPAPAAAAPATRWGKFTPDEFHRETDVYSKLKKKYANDPAMLKHMYGTQGYKDWETAGKAYMNRNKPAAPVKPTAPATTVPKPPARPSPGSAFPPRRPPASPSTRSGAAVPAVPKTVTAAASPDIMQQLQHIVAEKEAEGAIKKPKYKAAPNSVTTVKRYPQREDKDDAVGSSTIKYINRKGRPYVRPKKK